MKLERVTIETYHGHLVSAYKVNGVAALQAGEEYEIVTKAIRLGLVRTHETIDNEKRTQTWERGTMYVIQGVEKPTRYWTGRGWAASPSDAKKYKPGLLNTLPPTAGTPGSYCYKKRGGAAVTVDSGWVYTDGAEIVAAVVPLSEALPCNVEIGGGALNG